MFIEDTSFVVTTSADTVDASDNRISLREAVLAANANPLESGQRAITFDMTKVGPTIRLVGQMTSIATDVYIAGPGASQLTVTRDESKGQFRLFNCDSDTSVTIAGLTLTRGHAGTGGAIRSLGSLVVSGCVISDNFATNWGGGISVHGSRSADYLHIYDTVLTGNEADYGGAVETTDVSVMMTGSSVILNRARAGGGLRFMIEESLGNLSATLSGVVVEGNSADTYGGGIQSKIDLTLTGGTDIRGNQVTDSDGKGGGVHAIAGTVRLDGVRVGNNEASAGDGLYYAGGVRRVVVQPGLGLELYGGDTETRERVVD